MRERDTQKQRLYDAENTTIRTLGERYAELSDAQAYVDKVLSSAWVQTRWGQRRVKVGRGRGDGGRSYGGWITLGRNAQQAVVLHELAHELAPDHVAHGPAFAAIYLALVTRFMGAETGAALRVGYRQFRVRHRVAGAVPASGTHTVVTAAKRLARTKEIAARPLTRLEYAQAAKVLRRAIAADVFGPAGRKPRAHAQATARLLEAQS